MGDKMHTTEANGDIQKLRSMIDKTNQSDTPEPKKRFLVVGLLLLVAVIAGIIVFWNLFSSGDETSDRLQPDQNISAENIVPAEPELLSEPTPVSEPESLSEPELSLEENSVSVSVSEVETDVSPMEQPVQLITPDSSESISSESSNESVDVTEEMSNVWSLYLYSYYNKPPEDSDLESLNALGIPYEIIRAIVNNELWYRVQLYKHSEYRVAKEHADMLGNKYGIKGIWINRSKSEDD